MNIEKHYTWADFLKHVDWIDEEFNPISNRNSHDTDDASWYGTKTFQDALNLAKYGWSERLNDIKQLELKEIPSYKQIYQTDTVYGLAGSNVDIGRFLTGNPECMRHNIINSGFNIPAGFARLVVNNGCLANVSFEQKFNYGLKVVSIANSLELSNIRTEIDLLVQVDYSYSVFITLKKYDDSFYLEKVMFPISHIAFHRRLCFSERERNPINVRRHFGFHKDGGYGSTSNKFDDSDPNTLFFNGIHFDKEQINQKLARILERQQKFM